MEGNLVLAVLVAVVLMLAAFQTIQVAEISGKMSSSSIGAAYQQSQQTSGSVQQTESSSSPTMVGGC